MRLSEFNEQDFLTIKDFMTPLWYSTYGGIIPNEQIALLIEKYFSDDGLRHFRSEGYEYFKLVDGETVGIVVICEKDGATYLDKLYLTEQSRGKGYASFVFSELLRLGRDITLNVNQGNARAVRCYEKNGFVIEEEQYIDLGGGMVNKDYRMRLTMENFNKKST